MIKQIGTERNGIQLVKTYSDQGLQIRKVGTAFLMPYAEDTLTANFHYEETDMPLEEVDKEVADLQAELVKVGVKPTRQFEDEVVAFDEKEQKSYADHIIMMQDIVSRVSFDSSDNLPYDIPLEYVKEWAVGDTYTKGQLIKRHGVKYIVNSNQIVASTYVYPETITARVQYSPYQGLVGIYNWAYGERIVEGMKRKYEGVTYIAATSTSANGLITQTPDNSNAWEIFEE